MKIKKILYFKTYIIIFNKIIWNKIILLIFIIIYLIFLIIHNILFKNLIYNVNQEKVLKINEILERKYFIKIIFYKLW